MKPAIRYSIFAMGIAFMAVLVSFQWPRIVRGENDFAALYAGASLAGTPDLYSRAANEAVILDNLGTTMPSVIYTRPPFYAALLKPLTLLQYRHAYWLFLALDACSIGWFLFRFSQECPSLLYFAAFSLPLAAFLPQGQDAPFLLTFAGLFVILTRQGRDFLAGLVLSLCAIKFHLFLLVPVLLLIKKRWKCCVGGATGLAILFLAGVAMAGADSSWNYIEALRNPFINFSVDMMPSLHGLVATLHPSAPWEIALSSAVGLTFVWICLRTGDFELLFALSLVGSLLLSFHSGLSDGNLLLLAYVLIARSSAQRAVKIALAVTLTPVPYGFGASIGVPLMLLVVLAIAAVSLARVSKPLQQEIRAVTA